MLEFNYDILENEDKYLSFLDEIEQTLNAQNADKINDILDKIYTIKPVRLKWFLLKYKAMKLAGQNNDSINNILINKYNISYENDNGNLIKLIDHFIEKSEEDNDFLEKDRFLYHKCLKKISDGTSDDDDSNFLSGFYDKYGEYFSGFLGENYQEKDISGIIDYSYISHDYTSYTVFTELYKKLYGDYQKREWSDNNSGIEYLINILNKNLCFVVIENGNTDFMCKAVSKAIDILGGTVYYLPAAQKIEVDDNVNPEDTVEISIDNICDGKYCEKIIYPIELILNGRSLGNNIPYLLKYINDNYTENNLSYVICTGMEMEKLSVVPSLQKKLGRLCTCFAYYFENNMTYGWFGDYLSYISVIYEIDVHELFNAEPEYDYSIVIPVRNSIDTFKYTIKTCLNIEYDGSYEIVVSDNSSPGNNEVKKFIDELNDDRIHYYKPCRELVLTQSFEFANLNTKGKFVIPIGSDDGVLPWALDILDSIQKQCPDDELFLWKRGFYAWPGFNSGQQNQFIIPGNFIKGEVNAYEVDTAQFFKSVSENPDSMYVMPLLYINSGFKRKYMKKILDRTGRLWDGPCQDLYMGIINILINNHIIDIDYPLTIAGMSGHSIGYKSSVAANDFKNAKKNKYFSYNVYCLSGIERMLPQAFNNDVTEMYISIWRACARGLISLNDLYKFLDMKKVYSNQLTRLSKDDIYFEEKYNLFLTKSVNMDTSMREWFESNFHNNAFSPFLYNAPESFGRAYNIGYQKHGGYTLDASDFGVSDICGAVQLFKNITGL